MGFGTCNEMWALGYTARCRYWGSEICALGHCEIWVLGHGRDMGIWTFSEVWAFGHSKMWAMGYYEIVGPIWVIYDWFICSQNDLKS